MLPEGPIPWSYLNEPDPSALWGRGEIVSNVAVSQADRSEIDSTTRAFGGGERVNHSSPY